MLFNLVWGLFSEPKTIESTPPQLIRKALEELREEDIFVLSKDTKSGIIYKVGNSHCIIAKVYNYEHAMKIAEFFHTEQQPPEMVEV